MAATRSAGPLPAVALGLSVLGLGCGGSAGSGAATADLPVIALGEPTLEIGVLEGSEELVFGIIESVVRLPDGTIAVSDGDAARISIFGADGGFVRSWGRQGEGPGEFRSLSRIYPLGSDSLAAAERWFGRLTVFGLDGGLGRLLPGSELSGDTVFTLDSWLHGRFWVDGALTREQRARAVERAGRVSVPRTPPGYRYAYATEEGDLWVREPRGDGASHTWVRIGEDGPDAVITTPAAFRPTHIRADEVLGVWSGAEGVHFVRAYRPAATGETAVPPDWISASASAPAAPALTEEELMAEIRGAIRSLAGAQEMHYSTQMTYTARLDSLERFEQPERLHVDFLRADARGWAAVFTHEGMDRVCGLAYGFGSPPGWPPGGVLCAPETDEGAAGAGVAGAYAGSSAGAAPEPASRPGGEG
jgi:hypothetical protein